MPTLTAHCLVKNEENFLPYAVKSVIDFVDRIIIFDTGSKDKTVEIIQKLYEEYPNKILFEEKGECDKKRHTELRQEMIDKTTTDWFMILDGDEVWTRRGMEEAVFRIKEGVYDFLVASLYYCLGDIYHARRQFFLQAKKAVKINYGKADFFAYRFFKNNGNFVWSGEFDLDILVNKKNRINIVLDKNLPRTKLLNRYWHMTNLSRSSVDAIDFSSGNNLRKNKIRNTYFIIGKQITEPLPEVFDKSVKEKFTLNFFDSFINFLKLIFLRIS